jgi:hypothetical protein
MESRIEQFVTYRGHELEDSGLGLVEQGRYFIKTFNHCVVITNRTSHP